VKSILTAIGVLGLVGVVVYSCASQAARIAKSDGAPVSSKYVDTAVSDALFEAFARGKKGKLTKPFVLTIETSNNHGSTSTANALEFKWSPDIIKHIRWDGYNERKLANLAEVKILGKEGLVAYSGFCYEIPERKEVYFRFCGETYEKALIAFEQK